MTTAPIVVTDELADRLWYAQAALIHRMTEFIEGPLVKGSTPWNDLYGGRTGDDPGDYWNAAITIFHDLFDMRWDEDPKPTLEKYLNTTEEEAADGTVEIAPGQVVTHLAFQASDGICNELYELNCPALPKED